ncbi:MAG TPA: proton-conducting transporter membrane subunit [Thermoleophilaceae bacterium]|nr:proton-conducting transporter membrane subunit [Thermoleophilaceae bacterium]
MIAVEHLAPLAVVVPLLGAALIAAVAFLPRRVHELVAITAAAASTTLCAILLAHVDHGPIVYWLGNWRPHHGVALGISLAVDQFGAGIATLTGVLVLASLVYSTRYYDRIDGPYFTLVLVFMAAMVAFSLTGDLFNMFVFFELMSVAAFALTAVHIEERAPIQGAINFAVTNSVAGFGLLVGIALLYGRTGALNLAQIGQSLDRHPADALVAVGLLLVIGGFLTKAAAVPFHFWLADAHAVAPAPVSILFSGVMVEIGVFGVARVLSTAFAQPIEPSLADLQKVLVGVGVVTALVAAFTCFQQRHLKRLLAFSTISHMGIVLCGVGLLGDRALAGAAAYALGHGLAKGSLFLGSGTLLYRYGEIDEFHLRGRGRDLPVLGIIFAAGALVLAAAPLATTFFGKSLLEDAALMQDYRWLPAVLALAAAITGGAVLRATARIFLGWGVERPRSARTEDEERAQEEAAREEGAVMQPHRSTPLVLVAAPGALMLGAILAGLIPDLVPSIERAAAHFRDHAAYATAVLAGRPPVYQPVATAHATTTVWIYALSSTVGALVGAAVGLRGYHLLPAPVVDVLRAAHSGHVGDYIAWWTFGMTVLGAFVLWAVTG